MKSVKKIASLLLVLCIMAAVAIPAYADGETHTDGQKVESSEGSNHAATVVLDDQGENAIVTNDDDEHTADEDPNNAADIYVFAKVLDSSTKIYKVDIAWGAMKFQFTSTAGQWDPETHTYTATVVGDTGWALSYVDGTNNEVTVTNHSNNAIDATFAYAMDNTAFNANANADSVVGNFFADNDKAKAAAGVLTAVATGVTDKLADSKISLHTADAYSTVENPTGDTNNVAAEARTGAVFFAFSGTPDEGKGAALKDFGKVGVITVTIAPNTAMAGEYSAFVAAD